jgi:hypothetical protein
MKIFPYIYEPNKSIDVLKKTENYLAENPSIKDRIEELGWIYQTIGMTIPQTYESIWSGHFFPIMESWEELQISFNLCCFGLYKQAFVSLRSGLELGMLSVYYNINDEGHKIVKNWYNSKDSNEANTPRSNKIWNSLLSNSNIKQFNDKFNLKKKHDDLAFLHNYVHTKGYKFSNRLGIKKGNSQSFEFEMVENWLKSYAEVVSLICTMHLLKYPIAVIRFDYQKKYGIDIPSFGGLEEYNIDRISTILPEGYLHEIEIIANNDPKTKHIINEISSLPDMTENEVEEQIISLEKLFIENGVGFTLWLEQQNSFLVMSGQKKFSKRMQNRIEILKKWAFDNEFIEPIEVRLGWDKKFPQD